MKIELWGENGTTFKTTANKVMIGLHTHPGDGKQYMSVQVDDKELYFLNTLVYVNEGTEFKDKKYPEFLNLPLEYQLDDEIKEMFS